MNYPIELRRQEVAAINERRAKNKPAESEATNSESLSSSGSRPLEDEMPADAVALAISGGGIRCAALALGVLQALAKKNRLRSVDILSTVSGGGFTGAFLGRLFTRENVTDYKPGPCTRVQEILSDNNSTELQWLRTHANYLVSQGSSDITDHLAMFWRNIVTIYFVLGALAVTVMGLLRIAADWVHGWLPVPKLQAFLGADIAGAISLWWWLPIAVMIVAGIPLGMAYWLAPKPGSKAPFAFFPLLAWIVLFISLGLGLNLQAGLIYGGLVLTTLVLCALWLEGARLKLPAKLDKSTGETSADPGAVIRNRLSRGLGDVLVLFLLAIVWVLLDTIAQGLANGHFKYLVAGWTAVVAPVMPFLSRIAKALGGGSGESKPSGGLLGSRAVRAGLIAFPVAGLLLVVLDCVMHYLFNHDSGWGVAVTLIGAGLSVVLGWAFDFLNFSALQQSYAARLGRTFLGASNPARSRGTPDEDGRNVQVIHPDDDLPFCQYHPEKGGGPLHLIGLCVNETVDSGSQRSIRDLKGLPMCVSPCGVSVGRRSHALWSPPPAHLPLRVRFRRMLDGKGAADPAVDVALKSIPAGAGGFAVFKGRTDDQVLVESLRLSTWIAVSAAAFGTGTGRSTSLPLALLLGLVNVRLGYWWDSGLNAAERPGYHAGSLWHRIKCWPARLIRMQSLLLSDFLGRFGGPSRRFWNISDGGHFDVTAVYELVRRRVPFIVAIDGGQDPKLDLHDLGGLVRQVRIDFDAEMEFLDTFNDAALAAAGMPPWIANWLNADALGSLNDLGEKADNKGKHALLAKITYNPNGNGPHHATWMVVLKSSVTGDETLDVSCYKKESPLFPGEPTADQFFNEAQWESYRMLGEHIGSGVVKAG